LYTDQNLSYILIMICEFCYNL